MTTQARAALALSLAFWAPVLPAAACIPGGDQNTINAALNGPGAEAVLCPSAVFELTGTVRFTAKGQRLYTEGFPSDGTRALLRVVGTDPGAEMAIDGIDQSDVKLQNVVVDGGRPSLGVLPKGQELIRFGGRGSNILVDGIKAFEPRGWSALHVTEGGCAGAVVSNNEIGPSGNHEGGHWADGISLSCPNSRVTGNTIVDATDGAIVIFGSAGSTISNNKIYARTRELLGGINMVDYDPSGGDYSGTTVSRNQVTAQSQRIHIGIAMGPRVWGRPPFAKAVVFGGSVTDNEIDGDRFDYGIIADGVRDWTVTGNVSRATVSGTGCRGATTPWPFLRQGGRSSGNFQPEFREACLDNVLDPRGPGN